MAEIWKSIDEKYKLSNHGRVKSVEREVEYKLGGKRLIPERILRTRKNANGIEMVDLYLAGRKVTRAVHKLVKEHWG